MKKLFFVLLLMALLFHVSCSSMLFVVDRNMRITEKQVKNLYEHNGNAFYITSYYSAYSVVWTYTEDYVMLCKVIKGKVQTCSFAHNSALPHISKALLEEANEEILEKCICELDGDIFGYLLYADGLSYKNEYAVSIDSLKKTTFETEVINRIINDIHTYGIWEFQRTKE